MKTAHMSLSEYGVHAKNYLLESGVIFILETFVNLGVFIILLSCQ